MAHSDRGRIDYRKLDKIPVKPIIFDTRPIKPIEFIEEKSVEWENVKPNYYTVNTLGEVFNNKGHKMTPRMINSGYYSVALYSGHGKTSAEKYKYILLHRLVKETFDPINNPENYTVDHIDMNKANNRLSNLEYATQAENNRRKNINSNGRSHSNLNTYISLLNHDQIRKVIELIDSGADYVEVLSAIGLDCTEDNLTYIKKLDTSKLCKDEVRIIREELNFND